MAETKKQPDGPGVGDWERHPDASPHAEKGRKVPVGGLILAEGDIEINVGRPTTTLKVRNTGDRPIQVGSHFHFFEVNRAMSFDRDKSFGMRLDIPAGTAVRFEAGDTKEVQLVEYGGGLRIVGFGGLLDGSVRSSAARREALVRLRKRGYQDTEAHGASTGDH